MKLEIPINLSVKDFTIIVVIKQQSIDEEMAKLIREGKQLYKSATRLETATQQAQEEDELNAKSQALADAIAANT